MKAAMRAALALSCALLAGCGTGKPAWLAGESPEKAPPPARDREIVRNLTQGRVDMAFLIADNMSGSADPKDSEIGAYWKAICYLYRDQPDSALVIFEAFQGRWKGGWRAAHAPAFTVLAREAGQSQAFAVRPRRDDGPKSSQERSLQDKVDLLQKETGDLRAEIARLETEKKKYEKLLKDLETIR